MPIVTSLRHSASRYGFVSEQGLSSSNRDKTSTRIRTAKGKEDKLAAKPTSKVVLAIFTSSNIASTEVGMCCMNMDTNELLLTSFTDAPTYVRTIHKLNVYDPTLVLLPEFCVKPSLNKLAFILQSNMKESVKVTTTKSRLFNSTEGSNLLKLYNLDKTSTSKAVCDDQDFALAAASACIQHIKKFKTFSEEIGQLRIRYDSVEDTMVIDAETIKDLELVENLLDPKNGTCMFKVMNQCCTKMGERLLRTNLLQPLTDVDSIKLRVESVQELVNLTANNIELRNNLRQFQNLDLLLSFLIKAPKSNSYQLSDQRINNIIMIKSTLDAVNSLETDLQSCSSILLKEILDIFHNPELASLYELINEYINEDCTWAANSLELSSQKAYAVRSGKNGLLDVSRKLYSSIMDEVSDQVTSLAEQFDLSLDFRFDRRKGFHIRAKEIGLDMNNLPPVFINVIKKKKLVEFTTIDIMKQNSRFNDVIKEITILCDKTIDELHNRIEDYIPILFMVSEAVAILDLLSCFSYNATSSSVNYICPEFSDRLHVKQGRHPLLEKILKDKLVPNDYSSLKDISRFQVITGANMSGKSVYLRQLCYLVIMAQMGSFVPSDYAMMPIFKKLFARIGSDNISLSASLFSHEMSEMSFILKEANGQTLIIVDELGRGSSYHDGFSITIAMAEFLIESKATVFMATHFHELYESIRSKACVSALHMKVNLTGNALEMYYKAEAGKDNLTEYGIKYAEQTQSLPPPLIEFSKEISKTLRQSKRNDDRQSILNDTRKKKLILELYYSLKTIKDQPISDKRNLVTLLESLQENFVHEITNESSILN